MKALNKSLNKNLKKYHEDDLNEVFLCLKALVKNSDNINKRIKFNGSKRNCNKNV